MNWSEYCKPLFEKCKKEEIPFHACFELTPLCNFNCNMCYIHLTPRQAKAQGRLLSTDQWMRIAEDAKKMGTITLELTGGEAVTRPDFFELYRAFIRMGFLIHLRTNGYLIDQDIIGILKEYKPRKISVTLYGASDETYQRVCGISDGFSVVTRNIIEMKKAGLNVRLTMTVTNDNKDDVEVLEKWAEENGLFIIPFGALFTPIRGAKRSIEHLRLKYPEEESIIIDDAIPVSTDREDLDDLFNPFWLCRGFGAVFCMSWDGRMTLCNTLTEIWTDPLNDGLENAYHALYRKLKSVKRPKECLNCKYIEFCAACPSMLQSSTGKVDHTSNYVCKMARRRFNTYASLVRETV